MRHVIWGYPNAPSIVKSNNTSLKTRFLPVQVTLLLLLSNCGVSVQYSMTGSSTNARTISIAEFYNNTDLGPANMGQVFTNEVKNYFIQNTNLTVVAEEGELQLDGEISDFTLTPIAPTATGNPDDINLASMTRLTITVRATYVNTLDENMSFKDKRFSFYQDFPNDQNLSDIEDRLLRTIFERIIQDIFNASVANW